MVNTVKDWLNAARNIVEGKGKLHREGEILPAIPPSSSFLFTVSGKTEIFPVPL